MNTIHRDAEIRETMYIDADDPGLETHFPGAPTVPGSVLTMALVRLAARHVGTVAAVDSMSFRHAVRPGTMEASLRLDGDVVHCAVTQNGRTCVRGTLRLAAQTDSGGDA